MKKLIEMFPAPTIFFLLKKKRFRLLRFVVAEFEIGDCRTMVDETGCSLLEVADRLSGTGRILEFLCEHCQ